MHSSFVQDLDVEMEDVLVAPAKARPERCNLTPLCKAVAARLLRDDPEFKQFATQPAAADGLDDFIFAEADDARDAKQLFKRLRWGGLCTVASRHRRELDAIAQNLTQHGFAIEREPTYVREGWRIPIPFFSRKIHTFVARKVRLILPGETSNRFTYDVQLDRHTDPNDPIVVKKQVPTLEDIVHRLSKKHPDYPTSGLEKLARKFTDKIFPTFLTRETAMLMILQDHLPAPYNARVPRLIDMEKDERGFVRKMRMNWLRNGGPNGGEPITHMEFARQSADLLRVIHDTARVIHMDLRMDNMVITPKGVGFVDFGSAVREDEDLSKNPLLQCLFGELMKTSQIQKMMEQMTISGRVTSNVIRNACKKPDKAADFFYLALQFNSTHNNPDLAGLIQYDPNSKDARELTRLTSEILRPKDPEHPAFRSAKDILHGIERIQLGLDRK